MRVIERRALEAAAGRVEAAAKAATASSRTEGDQPVALFHACGGQMLLLQESAKPGRLVSAKKTGHLRTCRRRR